MSLASVKRFAEALEADPDAHNAGCSAWERKTGASLSLYPQELLDLVADLKQARRTIQKLRSNRKEALERLHSAAQGWSYSADHIEQAEKLLTKTIRGPWTSK